MNKQPIGIFDSGLGGLTVLKALSERLPYENIIYLGDTARVPYGNKSKESVTGFAVECLNFLRKKNVKLAVVACNTASSCSLHKLRKVFNFPVIGVIKPGVKYASSVTRSRRIGVIGTKATVNSLSYLKELTKAIPGAKVFQKACPLFVPLVEERWFSDKITVEVVKKYLKEIKLKKVDTLILGCTHYPMLKKVIGGFFGKDVHIVDSAVSISEEVKVYLTRMSMNNRLRNRGSIKLFVTDDPASFGNISARFLNKNIKAVKVLL